MIDFAPSFAAIEVATATDPGQDLDKSGLAGLDKAGTGRSGSLLNFRQREARHDTPGIDSTLPSVKTHGSANPPHELRDPVAHPMYRTRAEGAARPVYQACEEPIGADAAVAREQTPVSKKTEVDIAMFVEAVSAAFPRPRDPLMPRVLRARPKKAARPFLYFAEEENTPSEPSLDGGLNSPAVQAAKGKTEKVRPVVTLKERRSLVPYDPILEGDGSVMEQAKGSGEIHEARTEQAPYDPILAGAPLPVARGKVIEVNPVRPVEAHERALIHAEIEPLEPVAKPRFPLPTEVPGAAEPRLSPSQRAHLRRPTVVHDCNGRLTTVNYSLNPSGPGQD